MHNEKELHREYFALAEYAAFAKHQVMIDAWQQRLLTENNHNLKFNNDQFYFNENNLEKRTSFHSYISRLANATNIDSIVYNLKSYRGFEEFTSQINSYISNKEELLKNVKWVEWTKYIDNRLKEIKDFPISVLNTLLFGDLHFVYNEQFDRLTRKISLAEFQEILKDDITEFPFPVLIIGGNPIWTVGQAEIMNGEYYNLEKFTDEFPIQFSKPSCFELEIVSDTGNEEEDSYEFYNYEQPFYHELKWSLYPYKYSLEEILNVSNYILKRVKYAPDIEHLIGYKYLSLDNIQKAEYYLLKSTETYEKAIPEDFIGKIFDSNEDEYLFGLLYLGYINFVKGEYEIGKDYIEKADNVLSRDGLSFWEVVEFTNQKPPHEFINWFKDEFFTQKEREHKEMVHQVEKVNPNEKLKNLQNKIRNSKAIKTLIKQKEFRYYGSVEEGTELFFGKNKRENVTRHQYAKLITELKGKTIPVGASFKNPPTNSLGDWLFKNDSKRALAAYVAPILVHERFAEIVNNREIKIFDNKRQGS